MTQGIGKEKPHIVNCCPQPVSKMKFCSRVFLQGKVQDALDLAGTWFAIHLPAALLQQSPLDSPRLTAEFFKVNHEVLLLRICKIFFPGHTGCACFGDRADAIEECILCDRFQEFLFILQNVCRPQQGLPDIRIVMAGKIGHEVIPDAVAQVGRLGV